MTERCVEIHKKGKEISLLLKDIKDLSFELRTEKTGKHFFESNMKLLQEEEIDRLKKENEDLQQKLVNERFKNEVCSQQLEEKSDKISKLANEKAELLKNYEEKCLEVESLLNTGKLPKLDVRGGAYESKK